MAAPQYPRKATRKFPLAASLWRQCMRHLKGSYVTSDKEATSTNTSTINTTANKKQKSTINPQNTYIL
jgi:hypothetical protein